MTSKNDIILALNSFFGFNGRKKEKSYMKFEEKLITLRKQKLLSQEQLAEKLDVTRQTVSKWELGQSRPDMDKLTAMSKLFNVSIDTLTNDDVSLDDVGKAGLYLDSDLEKSGE